MGISAEEILAEIGPVQEVLDAHDGVVTVLDTSDGNIMPVSYTHLTLPTTERV